MPTDTARAAHEATNVLHAFNYFAPETEEFLVAAGLHRGRMTYFAGRAAPMGAVSAGVVAATFYNFNPAFIARFIPEAWALAAPEKVVAVRFDAVDAAFRRLLGAEVLRSAEMVRLAELTRQACSGCSPDGRPLYAGHADVAWPEPPHLVAWHALSLLREHRGDGHIAALVGAGLSGLDALVTHSATGQGFVTAFAKTSRGWSDEEWAAATDGLVDAGLLRAEGGLTDKGEAQRAEIEHLTDQLAVGPWEHLGAAGTEEVTALGRGLTRALLKAGALPETIFPRRG